MSHKYKHINQEWANFLTHGTQWALKSDRGAGPEADGVLWYLP